MMLLIEIVVGVLAVVAVAAVILGARSDDREASAKLDMLCADYEKVSNENAVLAEALRNIAHLGESGNQTQAPSAAIAREALGRVGRATVRADRYDVTPQPWRRFA